MRRDNTYKKFATNRSSRMQPMTRSRHHTCSPSMMSGQLCVHCEGAMYRRVCLLKLSRALSRLHMRCALCQVGARWSALSEFSDALERCKLVERCQTHVKLSTLLGRCSTSSSSQLCPGKPNADGCDSPSTVQKSASPAYLASRNHMAPQSPTPSDLDSPWASAAACLTLPVNSKLQQ